MDERPQANRKGHRQVLFQRHVLRRRQTRLNPTRGNPKSARIQVLRVNRIRAGHELHRRHFTLPRITLDHFCAYAVLNGKLRILLGV